MRRIRLRVFVALVTPLCYFCFEPSVRESSSLDLPPGKATVMFSAPSQSTTLLSRSFIAGLGGVDPHGYVVGGCPPEMLNPECSVNVALVRKCFGGQNHQEQIWTGCPESDMGDVLS